MRHIIALIIMMSAFVFCYADLTISKTEGPFETKEIYADGFFAEVIDNHVVSFWDFRKMQLTLIDHELELYTVVDFDEFRNELIKQTQARIERQKKTIDEAQRKQMSEATRKLYATLKPRLEIRDTTKICGYPTVQYVIFQDTLMIDRLWISKDMLDLISKEIPISAMKKAESIFKESRDMEMASMNLYLDGVTMLKERVMNDGYIMRHYDYGSRIKSSPSIYKKVESEKNEITQISLMKVDQKVFTVPKKYKFLKYPAYQLALIKANE